MREASHEQPTLAKCDVTSQWGSPLIPSLVNNYNSRQTSIGEMGKCMLACDTPQAEWVGGDKEGKGKKKKRLVGWLVIWSIVQSSCSLEGSGRKEEEG